MKRWNIPISAGLALAVVASVAAIGVAVAATSAPNVIKSANHPVSARVSAPNAASDTLLQQIMARVDSGAFAGATVADPPAGFDQFKNGAVSWITLTGPASTEQGPEAVKPLWESMLVAGAYRDLSAGQGVTPDAGFSTAFVNPDGSPSDYGGNQFVLGPTPDEAPADYSQDQMTQLITQNVAKLGVTLTSINYVQPNQYAPLVVLTTDDPAGFVKADYSLNRVFGDVGKYEGVYVEVDDSAGDPAVIIGVSNRIGETTRWIRSDLAPATAGDGDPNPSGGK